jgi:hypothetical protein
MSRQATLQLMATKLEKCSAAAVQGQRDSRSSTIAALNAAAITAYSKHIKQ